MLDWIDFPTKKMNIQNLMCVKESHFKNCVLSCWFAKAGEYILSRLNQRPICYGYSDAVKQILTAHSHGTQFQLAFGRYFLPLDSYEMV